MHALDVLGDPARRRVLELLAEGERPAGTLAQIIGDELGLSQPAVSQHLRVLRETGFVVVRAEGTRRLYSLSAAPLQAVDAWLEQFRGLWVSRLDALATEIARGKRQRRLESAAQQAPPEDVAQAPPELGEGELLPIR
ncbi:metalloregulator ArsR/SmtB family transcription factor [Myxococcota bacterium]|nr:metalloregulator ArsR/SmtB family transcription factor [Myxococcota bacterium]